MLPDCTRRALLLAASGAAVVSAADKHPIHLGGPIFLKSDDPAELAREHRRVGYGAAYCPDVKPEDTARQQAIEKAFQAENVVVAEVGAWCNMLDPDAAVRRENLRKVAAKLAVAEGVGARCCVNIAGSYNPKVWFGPHPRNLSREFLEATVENCRAVIDEIKPKRAKFAIEMMGWTLPDGPDSYLELIRAVDRPAFGVHVDVCNVINSPERFYYNRRVIAECFDKLGRWVVSCHAKDLAWTVEMNVHFVEVVPGRGEIDYGEYLRQIARLPVEAPLMLEHLKTAGEYEEGKKYIERIAAENGLAFA